MKLKKFSIIGLVVGALAILVGCGIPALTVLLSDLGGHSIGIIGGADLPTFEFVFWREEICVTLVALGIPLVLTSLFCLGFPNFVQKNFSVKTTALALGISATGCFGLLCFLEFVAVYIFANPKKAPISYPASFIAGVLALVLFLILFALYCKARKGEVKIVGIILDVLTGALFLPFFFLAEISIIEVIRNIFHLFA